MLQTSSTTMAFELRERVVVVHMRSILSLC